MRKKAIICIVITAICIVAAASLRLVNHNAEVTYTEAKVTVLSSETKTKETVRFGRTYYETYYEVLVSYQGQEHSLLNTHGTSSYLPGRDVTAFLYGGKLYANIEGVKSSTPLGTAYFVSVFVCFGMVIVSITFISKARKEKQ